MRLSWIITILIAVSSLTTTMHSFAQDSATDSNAFSSSIINSKGDVIGKLVARQGTQGVVLRITAQKLSAGMHGMHFHKVGNCSDTHHFKMAQGHIDPHTKPHGYFHPKGPHEGNLPNLIVAENGTVDVEIYTELLSLKNKNKPQLLDKDGSSLIIHANPDDHSSQPIGGSGARIACAVLKH